MTRSLTWPAATLASPLLLLALQGCAAPMQTDAPPSDRNQGDLSYNRLADGPLRIRGHNMGVYCFSTWGCRVVYGRHLLEDQPFDEWQQPIEKFPGLRERMKGTYGGLRAFEAPVEMEWLDSKRQRRTFVLDLAEVFPDRLIRYNVPEDRINPDASVIPPDIVIEIDDHTVRVYMRARIPLKAPRVPGNRYTNFVDENVLVYEKTL